MSNMQKLISARLTRMFQSATFIIPPAKVYNINPASRAYSLQLTNSKFATRLRAPRNNSFQK